VRSVSDLAQDLGYRSVAFPTPAALLADFAPRGLACVIVEDGAATPAFHLLALLRTHLLRPPVILVSRTPDIETAVRAIKEGAADYLAWPADPLRLGRALREAFERHRRELGSAAELAELRGAFDRLTPRERQVCLAIARGLLNKQIAAEVGMAEKTVKVHRSRIMWKLRVDSVPAMVLLLSRIGALDAAA
jgi:FixJ family two-component response regulator